MKTNLISIILSTVLTGCSAHHPHRSESDAFVIADLYVHCGPSWKVTVFPDGFAQQEVEDVCINFRHYKKDRNFSKSEVDSIKNIVNEARFFELPEDIWPATIVADESMFSLTVRMNGKEHKVKTQGVERTDEWPDTQRFLSVWNLIEKMFPPPTE
ncbi:hypothetical protein L0222_30815 [bacterium]|nr:hypothetical protein [bacterium]